VLFHVKRFYADMRGVRLWLLTVVVSTFAISGVTTYMVSFGLDGLYRGTLSPAPPREPLSFLRALDPDSDILADVESIDDLQDQLKTPGMALLLKQMTTDDRLFMVMPLSVVTSDPRIFPEPTPTGEVVVGTRPPFLRDAPEVSNRGLLWGELPAVPGIDDRSVGPLEVRRLDQEPPPRSYVAGNGFRSETGREALLSLTPEQAVGLGSYLPYSPAELMQYVTCYCDVDELAALAADMSEAELEAGSNRVFYAIGYDGLIGPSERSLSVTATLLAVFPAATGLSVVVFAAMATLLLWRRREPDYAVERLCGAGEVALQIRQQVLVLLAITAPAVAAFCVVDVLIQGSEPPPPWPPLGGPLAPLLALALHALVGVGVARRVHVLCRPRSLGVGHV